MLSSRMRTRNNGRPGIFQENLMNCKAFWKMVILHKAHTSTKHEESTGGEFKCLYFHHKHFKEFSDPQNELTEQRRKTIIFFVSSNRGNILIESCSLAILCQYEQMLSPHPLPWVLLCEFSIWTRPAVSLLKLKFCFLNKNMIYEICKISIKNCSPWCHRSIA